MIGFHDEYFSASEAIAVYQNHPSVIKIRDSYGDTNGSFECHPVAPSDISKKLKMLNIRKSTGYDNIPAKLLRIAHIELAQPMSHRINYTMGMNIFPDTLKCADVGPVLKKKR